MKFFTLLLALSASAFAGNPDRDLRAHSPETLVRYVNFYRGDDELVGDCMLYSDGTGEIVFDGMVPAPKPVRFRLSSAERTELHAALAEVAPDAKEDDQHFIPDITQQFPIESALQSKGGDRGYYEVKQGSRLDSAISKICNMDREMRD
jgi:hypothetical protein